MLVAVLPALALCTALIDWAGTSAGTSFARVLVNDLFVVYVYGGLPALLTSVLHTEITRSRQSGTLEFARLRSGGWGALLGGAAGLVVASVVSIRALTFIPILFVAGGVWGTVGGAAYGLLIGPAKPGGSADTPTTQA
jgi:hypothetical protein